MGGKKGRVVEIWAMSGLTIVLFCARFIKTVWWYVVKATGTVRWLDTAFYTPNDAVTHTSNLSSENDTLLWESENRTLFQETDHPSLRVRSERAPCRRSLRLTGCIANSERRNYWRDTVLFTPVAMQSDSTRFNWTQHDSPWYDATRFTLAALPPSRESNKARLKKGLFFWIILSEPPVSHFQTSPLTNSLERSNYFNHQIN